jgi:hypothetical protein
MTSQRSSWPLGIVLRLGARQIVFRWHRISYNFYIFLYFYILVSSCISITTPTFTIDWALRTVIALAGLGYVTWITIRCEDWGGQAFQIVLGEQVRTMLWEDGWSMFNQQGLESPEAPPRSTAARNPPGWQSLHGLDVFWEDWRPPTKASPISARCGCKVNFCEDPRKNQCQRFWHHFGEF